MSWVKTAVVLGGLSAIVLVKLDLNDIQPDHTSWTPRTSATSWGATAPTYEERTESSSSAGSLAPQTVWLAHQVALRRRRARGIAAWMNELQRDGQPPETPNDPSVYSADTKFLAPEPPIRRSLQQPLGTFTRPEQGPAPVAPEPPQHRNPYHKPKKNPHDFLSSDAGSIAAGAVYFVQSLIALVIGLIEYLRTERALEKIDEINEREVQAKQVLEAHTAALAQAKTRDQGSWRSAFALLPPLPDTVRRLQDDDVHRARGGYSLDFVTGLLILLGIIIAGSAIILLIDEAPRTG